MLVDQDFNDAFRYRLAQRRVAVLNQVEQDGREKVVDLWEMEQLNLNREFLQKFSMLSPRPNHEPEIGLEGDNFLKELWVYLFRPILRQEEVMWVAAKVFC